MVLDNYLEINMNKENQVSKHSTILWANINIIQQNNYYIIYMF